MNFHIAKKPNKQISDISKGMTEVFKPVVRDEVKGKGEDENKQPRQDSVVETAIADKSSKGPDFFTGCNDMSDYSSVDETDHEDGSEYFPYHDDDDYFVSEDDSCESYSEEPEEEIKDEPKFDTSVCTACYGIYINFLKGGSTKNRNYVFRNIEEIFADEVSRTSLQ